MPKKLIHSIKRNDQEICLSTSEYKNRQYFDIRIYFQDKNSGQLIPTKKGITLPSDLFTEFKKGMEKLEVSLKQN